MSLVLTSSIVLYNDIYHFQFIDMYVVITYWLYIVCMIYIIQLLQPKPFNIIDKCIMLWPPSQHTPLAYGLYSYMYALMAIAPLPMAKAWQNILLCCNFMFAPAISPVGSDI